MKERLKIFLEKEKISAKQLSETIGVQASSISHILHGRNKPSIEFIEKLLSAYPDLDIKWLITGEKSTHADSEIKAQPGNDLKDKGSDPASKHIDSVSKQLDFVLCFHTDGTFEKYTSA